jgi:hypothetical protein
MEGAKRSVQALVILRRYLECEKILHRLLDELARFDDELADELVHIGAPLRSRACSTSASGLSGFTS